MSNNLSPEKLLRKAHDFIGKSRCSMGHSVLEVWDNGKFERCIYCKEQRDLYLAIKDFLASPPTDDCPECSKYNVRYSVVMEDLQKLASKISGGDMMRSHGLDCTTVIAHHWDKAQKIIAGVQKACGENYAAFNKQWKECMRLEKEIDRLKTSPPTGTVSVPVAAFVRLSKALGHPPQVDTERDTVEEALIDEAVQKLAQPTEDINRLVRELDVLINGEEGAARQASLCDIVAQVSGQKRTAPPPNDGPCPSPCYGHPAEGIPHADNCARSSKQYTEPREHKCIECGDALSESWPFNGCEGCLMNRAHSVDEPAPETRECLKTGACEHYEPEHGCKPTESLSDQVTSSQLPPTNYDCVHSIDRECADCYRARLELSGLWTQTQYQITHITHGEEVVTGGPDGQTWIATFADRHMAELFLAWAEQQP